jgi:hypothetical protein
VLIRQSVAIPLPASPRAIRNKQRRVRGEESPVGDDRQSKPFVYLNAPPRRRHKENPASRRDFPSFQFTGCSSKILFCELAALLTLTALPVWILLLLAGFLTAALLLARLLTRVLILLTRVLVLVGHSGSPFSLSITTPG